ncbi:MAG: YhgE/Pip family protein [Leucobacter sp.]
MSVTLQRLNGGRAITWRTVLGLLLVPLTAAGVLLWGLWNPTDRLDTVTAAVVNLDEPVTLDGQLVPMGRLLAGELVGGDADTNFTWLLTDEADADAGLEDGRYATVVTIPKNFSAAATSASRGADEAETATIDIRTSERGRLLDSALSNIVTSTATAVLGEQLGVQFVGNVFVGMTQLGDGIGEAAGGARQLAAGGSQLADGADGLADGAAQLADGATRLAGGSGQLASGASDLASGAAQLAGGQRAAANGAAELATGVEQYVGGVNLAVGGLQDQTAPLIAQVLAAVQADTIPPFYPANAPTKEATEAMLSAVIHQLTPQDPSTVPQDQWTDLTKLIAGGTSLASGARASADGQAQLATGAEGLAGGLGQYAAGVAQYTSGVSQLAAGPPALAEGAAQLADGSRQAADGTLSLAEGLAEAADGVPSYSDEQAETMAEAMVRPVEAEGTGDELFNAAGVPLFAGIALWAGALASFLVLAPLWRRTREAARGVGFVTLRSALPAVAIGAAQGLLAGVILPPLLGYDPAQWLGFLALAVVAGVSFALVNQGLSALLGGFGRFLAFALLVVAFAIGVISTAPPLLQAIGDASPVGALFAGFQAVAMGATGGGPAILSLVLWGLGGLALTAFAVARERRRGF